MPKVDPIVRAEFNDVARRIIRTDRQSRKFGISQNTIGQIERALVDAYLRGQQGNEVVRLKTNVIEGAINWVEIPPRARDTLRSMTYSYCARFSEPTFQAALLIQVTEKGKIRWAFVHDDVISDRIVSNGSVAPLLRMGLVAVVHEEEQILSITRKGQLTCLEYWRRENANDRSLPIVSLR
jgi:hypothetical protein